MRITRWAVAILLGSVLYTSLPANSSADSSAIERQREGTKLQSLDGEFRETGKRWLLVVNGGTTYQILENLALQRAVQAIRDDPADRYWTVSGEVTEFMEENYLMVQRLSRTPRTIGAK